ncbi:MAG: patatin-like phospholipase family protein [Chitinophagales bacterium]
MKHLLGITLSGGAARGIAHIGVLQALTENEIHPTIISGCSAGAIAGVLYAAGVPPTEIYRQIENKNLYSIIKVGLPDKGMMELAYIRTLLQKILKHDSFDKLPKEFYLSVTNLNKGGCEIIHTGNHLIDFVIASSSIPLIFKPVKINNHLYVDGGVINNLPAEAIREKCKILIGVNVNTVKYINHINGIKDVGMRCLDISLKEHVQVRAKQCDILIEPDTSAYSLTDLTKASEIFSVGYNACMQAIPLIKEKIQSAYGTSAAG